MPIDLLKSETFAQTFVKDLEWRSSHPELSRMWSSGLSEWDRIVGGIGKGWYIVIIARLKGGKTGLLNTLGINLGKQSVRFVSISLEMHHLQMGARVFSNVAKIDMNKFSRLQMLEDDWRKVYMAEKEIGKLNGLWNYGANKIDDIEEMCHLLKPEVVLVDYLGLMTLGEDSRKSRYQEIGELSRRLKRITLPVIGKTGQDQKREEIVLRIESQRQYLGNESTDSMVSYMRQKWSEADLQNENQDDTDEHHMFPTIITAVQTSKEMMRKGTLDASASKDSNAPAEDADLVIAINDIPGPDGKPLQFKKLITVAASRVSGEGEFEIAYSPAQARMSNILSAPGNDDLVQLNNE
jgi:hypothetical protein